MFGGEITIATYADMGGPHAPEQADEVMWGQVAAENGFAVMAYDVQAERDFDRGVDSFYVSVRGDSAEEIGALWAKLAEGAHVRQEFGPAPWSPGYGMLTDRFGVTWVMDVAVAYPA